jgi:hypothetical protein
MLAIVQAPIPRLALGLQLLSKLSIEDNEAFIVPYFRNVLSLIAKQLTTSRAILCICYKLAFELMTLKACPRIALAVISGSPAIISAMLTLPKCGFSVKEHTFLGNVCFYALGQSISNALKSVPDTSTERQCRVILESGLMEIIPAQLGEPDTSQPRTFPPGFSRGLSFDITEPKHQSLHSDALKRGFLNDLLTFQTSSQTPSLATAFCDSVYKAVKNDSKIKERPEYAEAERFVIGALLKQTGYVSAALGIALSLRDSEKQILRPSPALTSIWKATYKIRRTLHRARQKSQERGDAPT